MNPNRAGMSSSPGSSRRVRRFSCADDLACYDDSVLMAEVDLIIQHVTNGPAFRVKGEGVAECRETWRGFGPDGTGE